MKGKSYSIYFLQQRVDDGALRVLLPQIDKLQAISLKHHLLHTNSSCQVQAIPASYGFHRAGIKTPDIPLRLRCSEQSLVISNNTCRRTTRTIRLKAASVLTLCHPGAGFLHTSASPAPVPWTSTDGSSSRDQTRYPSPMLQLAAN